MCVCAGLLDCLGILARARTYNQIIKFNSFLLCLYVVFGADDRIFGDLDLEHVQ